jgi:hypothetical protein
MPRELQMIPDCERIVDRTQQARSCGAADTADPHADAAHGCLLGTALQLPNLALHGCLWRWPASSGQTLGFGAGPRERQPDEVEGETVQPTFPVAKAPKVLDHHAAQREALVVGRICVSYDGGSNEGLGSCAEEGGLLEKVLEEGQR